MAENSSKLDQIRNLREARAERIDAAEKAALQAEKKSLSPKKASLPETP